MKSTALAFCILVLSFRSQGQSEQLVIKRGSKGPYVEHKVAAKENFYSIGRSFNVHPKHLAVFNSLDMTKGLHLGQTIKIPLSDTNYTHKSETGMPVYYVTGNGGETIYNVSTNNNVLLEKLRKWNHIPGDKLPAGSKLVVGYLVTTPAVAGTTTSDRDAGNNNPRQEQKEAAASQTNSKTSSAQDATKQQDQPTKESPKKEVSSNTAAGKEQPKTNPDISQPKQETNSLPEQGFFKSSFDQQVKQQPLSNEQTVTSGVFKTSSGWTDGKYYLLMDGVEPGTIVRITNPTNNKIAYAKLLGDMADANQSRSLNIRISNAAAAALDISDTEKFILKLNY